MVSRLNTETKMYIDGRDKAKIGKVNIDKYKNSYRARFTYPKGKRHQIVIASAQDDGWFEALTIAKKIDSDIKAQTFDFSYEKYLPQQAQQIEIVQKNWNLFLIWEQYKETNKNITELTTQKASWKQTDNCLDKVSKKALQLDKTDLLLSELLAIYSIGTIERTFANLKAACYLSLKRDQIQKNPFVGLKLPKRAKPKIECYESDEIKVILEAFKSDEYMSKYARVSHSYYYHYIKFCALTFCRPEDAIALTWNDIRTRSNGTFISFTKAYSRGILKDSKTHEIRLFKCNDELVDFIKTIPFRKNEHNLLFPTPRTESYMDQRSWGRDLWKPVVSKIVADGKVHKYLKFYSLRHSGITRLVRAGIDVATIARLAGTSPDMILNNYLAARNDIDLPQM